MIVDDKGIKDCWKEYMEKLMNEENEWDHKISAEVKEGPADRIRMDEVRAALKKMKKHKAPGLSGLVTEMIQATGDTGTQLNSTEDYGRRCLTPLSPHRNYILS